MGAGAMIVNLENEVLLVRKSSKKTWSFPAGLLSVGEDLSSALNREIKEELGLDAMYFKMEGIIGMRHRFNPKHGNNIFVVFLLRCKKLKPKIHIIDREEIAQARFFSFNDIIKNKKVDWIVKEIFKKYMNKKYCLLAELDSEYNQDDSLFYKLFL